MTTHSKLKLLPYTCYELGHTWHHSCTRCSFDMFISSAIASFKIYGVVYLLTALVSRKKITKAYAIQLFKNYLQSMLFLSFNGCFFVASFCVLRLFFGHINFLTAAWMPGFIASYLAILVERTSRRPLLALYTINVASECVWNGLKGRGYVKPIPRGEVLLFAAPMVLFGYYFKSTSELNPLINSAFKLILGSDEADGTAKKPGESSISTPLSTTKREVVSSKNSHKIKWRHKQCPHEDSCIANALKMAGLGFVKGYLLEVGLKTVRLLPALLRRPSLLLSILSSRSSFKMAAALAWFASVFKGTCCLGRWFYDKDKPVSGAFAGGAAALAMLFYSSPSVALYAFWKSLEVMYTKAMAAGYVPAVPQGVELSYALSTAFLFHVAVMEQYNMKPSYWVFLNTLTIGKIGEFNKTLLDCYGLDSGRLQVWPSYDKKHLTQDFIRKFYS